MRFVHNLRSDGFSGASVDRLCNNEWTRMDTNFFAVSAMLILAVVAAVPAANVIHAGDTPASTVPLTAIACSGRSKRR
jgi:hypothetical protein